LRFYSFWAIADKGKLSIASSNSGSVYGSKKVDLVGNRSSVRPFLLRHRRDPPPVQAVGDTIPKASV